MGDGGGVGGITGGWVGRQAGTKEEGRVEKDRLNKIAEGGEEECSGAEVEEEGLGSKRGKTATVGSMFGLKEST